MSHDHLDNFRQIRPYLRLPPAGNAPLIISFLLRIFIQPDQRPASQSVLTRRREDYPIGPRSKTYHFRRNPCST